MCAYLFLLLWTQIITSLKDLPLQSVGGGLYVPAILGAVWSWATAPGSVSLGKLVPEEGPDLTW